jgi:acyl-CoA synthetase (AMP-forming)/AMP-acid ligase II
MTIMDPSAPRATITQRLLGLAPARGAKAALVGGAALGPGQQLSYADFARMVQASAAGLAWHGVRHGDAVGVCAPDAVSYALAVHAIRAAGAVPSPVCGAATVAGMAAQLSDCAARMLITGPPLVPATLAAVERSWVRQVISFGDEPGTVPFSSLLSRGSQQAAWCGAADLALLRYRGGPDGGLQAVPLTHDDLAEELRRLAVKTPMTGQDVVIAAPPTGEGQAYGVLIDLALLEGATIVATSSTDTTEAPDIADAARVHGGTAAIVYPGTPLPQGLSLRLVTAAC